MIATKLLKMSASSHILCQSRGIRGLPVYDPAAAIHMKWSVVYMGVFMGFWGLAYLVNPFRGRNTMDKNYEIKWQKEQ